MLLKYQFNVLRQCSVLCESSQRNDLKARIVYKFLIVLSCRHKQIAEKNS